MYSPLTVIRWNLRLSLIADWRRALGFIFNLILVLSKKTKITSFTTLDNSISFPCSMGYVPKAVKTGEIENGKILSQIRTFQMCSCCLQIKKFNNHIIEHSDACSSRYELCVQINNIWAACIKLSHSSYLPYLRVCIRCLEHNQKGSKRIFVTAIANCEEGNKAAFRSLKVEIEQDRKNPELALLTPIPAASHIGKSMKAAILN